MRSAHASIRPTDSLQRSDRQIPLASKLLHARSHNARHDRDKARYWSPEVAVQNLRFASANPAMPSRLPAESPVARDQALVRPVASYGHESVQDEARGSRGQPSAS